MGFYAASVRLSGMTDSKQPMSVMLASAETPLALALDLGTSSIRAVVYDRLGRSVEGATHQVAYGVTTSSDGGVEADPSLLVELAGACIDGVLRGLSEDTPIAAVGISCFWHSLMGVDANGAPTTAMLYWADNRSVGEAESLRHELDERAVRQRTGTVFHSSYWPAKLLWLRRTLPDAVAATRHWISVGDYLALRWLDELSTSICMASATGLFDIQKGLWDEDLAAIVGVPPEALPPLVDRNTACSLNAETRRRWPALANATWFPALGDGACANVGCGAVTNDRIAMTLGTTGALRLLAEHPIGTETPVYDDLFAYRLDSRTVVYGAAISNGGILLDWLRNLLGDASEELLDRAALLEPDRHGLTILPFVAGERAPVWNDHARAVIAGLNLSTEPADLIRAGMESVALRMALIYRLITPIAAPRHHVIANGAALLRSPTWMHIVADALGWPVSALPSDLEASARGAALSALQGIEAVSSLASAFDPLDAATFVLPDPTTTEIYREAGNRQRTLEDLLFPDRTSWSDA
jgi:gluconokinase